MKHSEPIELWSLQRKCKNLERVPRYYGPMFFIAATLMLFSIPTILCGMIAITKYLMAATGLFVGVALVWERLRFNRWDALFRIYLDERERRFYDCPAWMQSWVWEHRFHAQEDAMLHAIECNEAHLPGDCPLCGAK